MKLAGKRKPHVWFPAEGVKLSGILSGSKRKRMKLAADRNSGETRGMGTNTLHSGSRVPKVKAASRSRMRESLRRKDRGISEYLFPAQGRAACYDDLASAAGISAVSLTEISCGREISGHAVFEVQGIGHHMSTEESSPK